MRGVERKETKKGGKAWEEQRKAPSDLCGTLQSLTKTILHDSYNSIFDKFNNLFMVYSTN